MDRWISLYQRLASCSPKLLLLHLGFCKSSPSCQLVGTMQPGSQYWHYVMGVTLKACPQVSPMYSHIHLLFSSATLNVQNLEAHAEDAHPQ